jgi:hypothetical protein
MPSGPAATLSKSQAPDTRSYVSHPKQVAIESAAHAVSKELGLSRESPREGQVKILAIQSSPRGESSDSISLARSLMDACNSNDTSIVVDKLNVWHEWVEEFVPSIAMLEGPAVTHMDYAPGIRGSFLIVGDHENGLAKPFIKIFEEPQHRHRIF